MFSSSLPTSTWACTSACTWPHTHTKPMVPNCTYIHARMHAHTHTHTHTHTSKVFRVQKRWDEHKHFSSPSHFATMRVHAHFSSNKTSAWSLTWHFPRAMPTDMGSDFDHTWRLKYSPAPISQALELAPDDADEHWFQTLPGTGIKVLTCCCHWYRWLCGLWDVKIHWNWPEMMQMNIGSKLYLALGSKYSLIQVTINWWVIKLQELPDYQILTCPHHWYRWLCVVWWDIKFHKLPDCKILIRPHHWCRWLYIVWLDAKFHKLPDYKILTCCHHWDRWLY